MFKMFDVEYQINGWDKVKVERVIAKSVKAAKEVVAKQVNREVSEMALVKPTFLKKIK